MASSVMTRLWLILGATLLLIGGFIGWDLYAGRSTTDAREREWLAHQARVIDENLRSQLTATDHRLNSIRDDLPFLKKQKDSKVLINTRLKAMTKTMPGVRTLFVFDADATVTASNREELIGLNFRQRDYYQTARQSRNPAMIYVSPPYKTILGVFAMTLVKVIPDERGEVVGMVGVTIDPEYFKTLIDSVRYAPGMLVFIAHGDGKLFLSSPQLEGVDGKDLATPGTLFTHHRGSGQIASMFTGISDITGDECIAAQRSIQLDLPIMDKLLVVGVSRTLSTVYSSWNREASFAGGLFGALVLAAAIGLYSYQRRQHAYGRLLVGREEERKRAEETLRESEEKFRNLFQGHSAVMLVIDPDTGEILDANDAAAAFYGWSMGGLKRMRIQQINTKPPEEVKEAMDRVRSSKGMVLEYRHRRADGSIRDVEVFSRSIEIRRKVFLYSIIHDITERKRAEEALHESEAGYRVVYEGATEGMFQTSTAGRILAANDSLARILGYDSAEEVVDMVEDIARQVWVNADERAEFIRRVEQQGVVRQHECQFVRKDGEKIWVSLNGKLIRGPDGEVAHVQEFAEDISDRKHAEEKLKTTHLNMRNLAVHLLRSREEERRAVAQEVHDQVGQQLAALKMDLHWLGKRLPATSAALGQRVNGMIDLCEEAIREVQRIAADLRPRMLDDLGLAPALQQLGADFARRAGITCTVSASFPARLVGGNAATALYRLTQEALANVRRHSQAHHAGVRLSLEKADLVLQIEDDGKGITCEQAEAPDSYGLIGLRERVAGLGGRLSIQGQPGKGTILTASIPLPEEGGLA